MSKKRGFTLVEVLVVIALTTLVFALVGGTFVFLATSSGDLIHKSESIIQAQTIEKHLRSLHNNDDNDDNKITFDDSKADVYHYAVDNKVVIWNSTEKILTINGTKYEGIDDFSLSKDGENNDFVRCTFTIINNGKSAKYTFILGIYTQQ